VYKSNGRMGREGDGYHDRLPLRPRWAYDRRNRVPEPVFTRDPVPEPVLPVETIPQPS